MARQQEQQLATLLDGWEGEASRAYATKITALVAALREGGRQMTGTADSLGDTATDLRTAEELVRTIIREPVEWLVITWLAAQALAWATAAAFVLDPKRLAIKPVITLTGLDGDLVGETVEGLLDGLVDATADEADDHRNGTDGSATGTDSAFREWVSGVADPVADRTAPVVDPLVDSLDGGTP